MIDKLELLLALAKERHFGRAAEACGVTQPTMSTSLKQLEEILGVMLVQRGSRFQGFTPEGERTLDWARRIVGDARAMKQEINSLKDKLSGEIRIAAIPTALGMVASLTTPFRARHPDVRFRIQSCTSADVLGLLENLEVDAGLTYIENEPIGWDPSDHKVSFPWGLPARQAWFEEATPFADVPIREPQLKPRPLTLESYLAK